MSACDTKKRKLALHTICLPQDSESAGLGTRLCVDLRLPTKSGSSTCMQLCSLLVKWYLSCTLVRELQRCSDCNDAYVQHCRCIELLHFVTSWSRSACVCLLAMCSQFNSRPGWTRQCCLPGKNSLRHAICKKSRDLPQYLLHGCRSNSLA
jgi:hypothetical protein